MRNAPYPEELEVTLDDFKRAMLELDLSNIDLMKLCFMFREAEQEQKDDDAVAKVLWLFSAVCSMRLDASSNNDPLKPFSSFGAGNTSPVPDFFTVSDLELFKTTIPEIQNPALKARLADLLWLRRETRNIKYARLAIDSYIELPLSTECKHDSYMAWERSVRLCLQIRTGADSRLERIKNTILDVFMSSGYEDHIFLNQRIDFQIVLLQLQSQVALPDA